MIESGFRVTRARDGRGAFVTVAFGARFWNAALSAGGGGATKPTASRPPGVGMIRESLAAVSTFAPPPREHAAQTVTIIASLADRAIISPLAAHCGGGSEEPSAVLPNLVPMPSRPASPCSHSDSPGCCPGKSYMDRRRPDWTGNQKPSTHGTALC